MSKSLQDGIRVFEAIATSPGSRSSISRLSNKLSLNPSKTHRLLLVLRQLGYVEQEKKSGHYRLTSRAWILSCRSVTENHIFTIAIGRMNDLYDSFKLNVHLSVLDGFDSVYMYIISGKDRVENYSQVAGRNPAGLSATGKVLISRNSVQYLEECHAHSLNSYKNSPGWREFYEEIVRVREEGLAYNYGTLRENVWGVAAPVFDGAGRVIAALGLSGHRSSYGEAISSDLKDHLRQAAISIKNDIYGSQLTSVWF